jgi:multidrug efflux pump subunit AcrA (membrane-fusion protein)
MTRRHSILILALTITLAACREAERPTEAASVPQRAIGRIVTVEAEDWPAVYEAVGTVRARSAATISARVPGYVRDVRAQVGDRVVEGQSLIILDARDLDAGLRQAEAAREEARAALPEMENAVAAARANLELAQVTFTRMQDLFGRKSISNQEYDEASARLKAAQANHQMVLAKRAQLD